MSTQGYVAWFADLRLKDVPSVGGKNVTEITNPEQADQGPIAIYANGDTLFFAQSADPALLATGIAALP